MMARKIRVALWESNIILFFGTKNELQQPVLQYEKDVDTLPLKKHYLWGIKS